MSICLQTQSKMFTVQGLHSVSYSVFASALKTKQAVKINATWLDSLSDLTWH